MASPNACPVWRPDDCDGGANCPPRCPRYVAPDGTAYTVYDRAECPVEPPSADEPAGVDPATAETSLVAVGADEVVGVAAFDGATAGGRVELEAGADPAVGTELARQLVARRASEADDDPDGDGWLTIRGPASSLSRLADELGDASTVSDGTDPSARAELDVDLTADAARRTAFAPARRADVTAPPDVAALVDPETVAVVGATDREGAIGRVVVENLLDSFDGEVIPVTPRHDAVCGLPVTDSVDALEQGAVDLAVVVLPSDAAVEAVRDAAAAGVDAVAVLSAGFGESDDEAGAGRERELGRIAAENDLALVGPNALGVISTRSGLNASFAPTVPTAGGVSVLSHSGAMITAILDWAAAEGVGVRDVVSVGNGAGIGEEVLLRHWGRDPETSVVLAYLEDVADGRTFVEAAREVTPSTPVVALKSGRSEAGAAAAASHTGALVGDDAGFDAAFDAAGVIRVGSQRELYDLVSLFETRPLPAGDRVAVVTNAGGPGVLATDAVAAADLAVAEYSAETTERLADALPDAASAANPVDVLGDADVDRFVDALEIVLADPGVDVAIVVTTPHPLVSRADLARAVGDAGRRYGKPVLTCFSGGPLDESVRNALAEAGVPNYPDADRAATALAAAASYVRDRGARHREPTSIDVGRERVDGRLRAAGEDGRTTLGVESMDLLDDYGVTTPESTLARSRAEAIDAARAFDGPVAMKVAAPEAAHKTEVGAVAIDVPVDEVGPTYDELLDGVRDAVPDATVRGILVQAMAPDGVECLVGVTRHPRFGPLVTFGLGGVLVEHLEDVAHGLPPLSKADARELIRDIEAAGILDGARGRPPADLDALADALVRLSRLAVDQPAIREFEVNPLVAAPDGAFAVDFHAELVGEDGSGRPG
ncbi:acetate--CoA ligase family protein [Halovivax sp.]|uniref:acetate--CoA ligase family protein n=1 Tax=Halovivax sp. TaxID=1935978 RepID=UPI0025B7B832|nr:acetate--CoA ligase family protein [Halovivax sp.]